MSVIAKILQNINTKTRTEYVTGIYLAWDSEPKITSSRRKPLQFPISVPKLNPTDKSPLSLLESRFYYLAPKNRDEKRRSWIIRAEELDSTTWKLRNPWSGAEDLIFPYPIMVGKLGDPSNYHLKELAKAYTLVDEKIHPYEEPKTFKVSPSFDPIKGVSLVAIDRDLNLCIWKQGDEKWTIIELDDKTDEDDGFSDIACHADGKFYATDFQGRLFHVDPIHATIDIIPNLVSDMYKYLQDLALKDVDPRYRYKWEPSMVHYDGKLCLLDCYNGITFAAPKGHEISARTEWEYIKELKKDEVLFKINEVSFSIPAELLDRKFEGGWMCYSNNAQEQDDCGGGCHFFDQGEIHYGEFSRTFHKAVYNGGYFTTQSFFTDLPDDEYVSLFFPPPPWIQYHWLDPEQGFPSVKFDRCHVYHRYSFSESFI